MIFHADRRYEVYMRNTQGGERCIGQIAVDVHGNTRVSMGVVPIKVMQAALNGVVKDGPHRCISEDYCDPGDNIYLCREEKNTHSVEWWLKANHVEDKKYSGTFHVNAYMQGRAYGGPEEGGWWYNYLRCNDVPVDPADLNTRVRGFDQAVDTRLDLVEKYPELTSQRDPHTFEQLVFIVERFAPMDKPIQQPCYC